MYRLAIVFVLLLAGLGSEALSGEKIHPRLANALESIGPDDEVLVWVYLNDKGTQQNVVPLASVSERSLQRRAKVRRPDALVDFTDLPLNQRYVQRLVLSGIRVRHQSKWFNSVSALATRGEIGAIEGLPFVTGIDLVARFKRSTVDEAKPVESASSAIQPAGVYSFNYGSSFGQVNQINVPAVHDRNNYAQGVVVGVFDNGFRLLTHEAFDTLRPRILATYDFVDHKVSVVPNNPSSSFGSHGVNTLSTIGGFKSGQLIGPAFGATYLLARTENDSSETPIEEDNWVAAIEWADSIGVDVTSTSLGYLDYDVPNPSWTWEDMDGNTTVITRAADMAVERGIVVVNSAGNAGLNASHNTLGAPADGDSVLTVGAVNSSGTRSSFSSVGPTTSVPPRIKPDVMAQGSSVRVASATNTTGYGSSSGTSFSCPLAAGVVALLLQARPTDSPMEIVNALRSTASRASTPDNLYGWGILNAMAALSPSAVSLQSPNDGVSDQPTSISLVWTKSKWATAYRIQVASDSAFTTLILNDSTLVDSSAQLSGLQNGETYYWRVSAKNLYGTSSFTSGWSFSTVPLPPVAPVLLSPTDGAPNVPTSATLTWNSAADAEHYRIQVSEDSIFTVLVLDDSTVTIPSRAVSGIAYATTFFWHVNAGNSAGTSPYSTVWRFTTAPAPPLSPSLVSPSDGSTGLPSSVTLTWNQATGTITYRARISTDSMFATTILDDSTITDTTRAVASLSAGARYYWQVQASNEGGASPWSEEWAFSINPATTRTYPVEEGWNLISLPLMLTDTRTSSVFPDAISPAFRFINSLGYVAEDTLHEGLGYWLKFGFADSLTLAGEVVLQDTIEVIAGWNLVGGISTQVETASIITVPSGIVASSFYEYVNGYDAVSSLEPSRSYWVKVGQSGVLVMQTPEVPLREKRDKAKAR